MREAKGDLALDMEETSQYRTDNGEILSSPYAPHWSEELKKKRYHQAQLLNSRFRPKFEPIF